MKATVETKKNELRNEMKSLFETFKENADKLISASTAWKVIDTDSSYKSVTLYLALSSDESKQINIRYSEKISTWQAEEFSTNISARGSFELLDANEVANYYIAVGNLLSAKETLAQIKEIMKELSEKIYKIRKEYDKLEEED